MKSLVSLFAAGAASMAFATPSATVVSASAVDGGQALEVTYTLSEDAIVTMAVATNASATAFLDDSQVTALSGDVNRKVLATSGQSVRTLRWECGRENVSFVGLTPAVVLTAWQLDQPPDIMAFHVLGGDSVRFYTSVNALPGGLADSRYRTAYVVMRKIPAKGVIYTRGASATTTGVTQANESTFSVTMTNDYYIGIYPFTAGQAFTLLANQYWNAYCQVYAPDTLLETPACGLSYEALRGAAPSVNWPTTKHDVASGSLIDTLRSKTGLSGLDLPTESEWEYAARSGRNGVLWNGSATPEHAMVYAWCRSNSPILPGTSYRYMSPVGRLKENDWGLYDALGDLPEWCLDWIESDTTKTYVPADSDEARQGPASSTTGTRAIRGHFCAQNYNMFSLSQRSGLSPSETKNDNNAAYGFRLVCPVGF